MDIPDIEDEAFDKKSKTVAGNISQAVTKVQDLTELYKDVKQVSLPPPVWMITNLNSDTDIILIGGWGWFEFTCGYIETTWWGIGKSRWIIMIGNSWMRRMSNGSLCIWKMRFTRL